jgi:hypothetical protein
MQQCAIYDLAALMLDRTMMQLFSAHGLNPVPATVFTNDAFDARTNTYGEVAFAGDSEDMHRVAAAAQRVLAMVWPTEGHHHARRQ